MNHELILLVAAAVFTLLLRGRKSALVPRAASTFQGIALLFLLFSTSMEGVYEFKSLIADGLDQLMLIAAAFTGIGLFVILFTLQAPAKKMDEGRESHPSHSDENSKKALNIVLVSLSCILAILLYF